MFPPEAQSRGCATASRSEPCPLQPSSFHVKHRETAGGRTHLLSGSLSLGNGRGISPQPTYGLTLSQRASAWFVTLPDARSGPSRVRSDAAAVRSRRGQPGARFHVKRGFVVQRPSVLWPAHTGGIVSTARVGRIGVRGPIQPCRSSFNGWCGLRRDGETDSVPGCRGAGVPGCRGAGVPGCFGWSTQLRSRGMCA